MFVSQFFKNISVVGILAVILLDISSAEMKMCCYSLFLNIIVTDVGNDGGWYTIDLFNYIFLISLNGNVLTMTSNQKLLYFFRHT